MDSPGKNAPGSGLAVRAVMWTLAALLFYPLSSGPVWWGISHGILPHRTLAVYKPLTDVPPLHGPMIWYWTLWAPYPYFAGAPAIHPRLQMACKSPWREENHESTNNRSFMPSTETQNELEPGPAERKELTAWRIVNHIERKETRK